ncbi:DEAD/DEAH box helicase [Nannocystis pusilla]|uniref:DEAD/DEAH box helicase n=1 Tax=Nannocystis pusilla TaxID=889268 RepID=A0ABS7TN90_9BACT|nr:DEAD/DEAH box helicase [Nannocystis pusilla]MBZ5709660.1 DEAD/DEAH box helicase [Nannocystis pusilla]
MRAASPPDLWPYIDAFLRKRAAAPSSGRRAADKPQARGETPRAPEVPVELPPDLTSISARTKANVQALELVAHKRGRALSEDERRILLRYSDWGGLSIDKIRDQLPKGLTPEDLNLSHGYYTPTIVAEAIGDLICPLLPDLAGRDGIVRALEPSVGTGRLVRALGTDRCAHASGPKGPMRWTTIELSKPASAIFTALHPEAEHHNLSFETWVQRHAVKIRGTLNLVVSNPPYGTRGELVDEDPERDYRERTAFAYFMRRSLDLLVPGGLGVFLVPAGFLTGSVNRGLRERLLRRHHLAGAYRLPSRSTAGRELFPGASVVVDLLVWRSRGGELARVDAGDAFIVDGRYFEEFPGHVLGQAAGEDAGDDETGKAKSTWRYAVVGDFAGLPPFRERPICETCTVRPVARRAASGGSIVRKLEAIPEDLSELEHQAVLLGQRVSHYLALRAADDDKAVPLWAELYAALESFSALVGNPHRVPALRALVARRIAAAEQLLNAFEPAGALIAALRSAPVVPPRFTGQPDDVVAQAEALFRKRRRLTLDELARFHADIGGTLATDALLEQLLAAGWCLDGVGWDELVPRDVYATGIDLWAKHDRAHARAEAGDPQAKVQLALLVDAIAPAVLEDIDDVSPNYGYVPFDLLSDFVSTFINVGTGEATLVREAGHIKVSQSKINDATRMFVGWLNHDWSLFKPESDLDEPDDVWARRRMRIAKWTRDFREWITDDADKRARLVEAYNRANRGRIIPTYPSEPLELARWGADAVTLRPHQIAGARRILANFGGILAFDVGVGKTHTAIAVIAAARQEGSVRRPVVLVPGSLVWKWYDDFAVTLPDYRVLVIGSKRKRVTKGVREGVLTSVPDTPEEQAQKWITLQAGGADVVILSYEALALTRMNEAAVLEHTQSIEAIQRSITMDKYAGRARIRRLTERDRSVLRASTAQWVREMLSLPRGRSYVPGIAWDEIGIDLLVVDEAASFKNLYMPAAREGGIPLFMGASREGAQRAWQLDFRAAAVRKRNGGGGIVLISATPAKNSPLELYNLIQYVDPRAFISAGIYDPEQFIDRFLRIEKIPIQNSAFRPVVKPACVGFKNLEDLRTLILTYTEFRTAKEVGIDLPETLIERIPVTMNEAQEAKYKRYLSEMEEALKHANFGSTSALGLLSRLSLVAIHPALDEGYDYRSALEGGVTELEIPSEEKEKWTEKGWSVVSEGEEEDAILVRRTLGRPLYESPKITRCAEIIAASAHCGHIIFCEPTASHQWIREILVQHGIPRDRIAVMNAEVTSGQDRIRIAREFNGLSAEVVAGGKPEKVAPKFDVVIANSVASEGIDLQVRTCSIHHIDLPWTPADLEQRNGRAIRQGNVLGTVTIYYYLAERSSDSYRFEIIHGKAQWLGEILASAVRDTNNPAAQQRLSKDEILLMISRNPEATRLALEEKARRESDAQRTEAAFAAARRLRQANARFREARATGDPELAARLRQEGEKRLSTLSHEEPSVWPWTQWMYAVRDTELLVPEDGSAPVYEGLRVIMPPKGRVPGVAWEFGAIVQTSEGPRIGRRDAGGATWTLVDVDELEPPIRPEHLPGDGAWPPDDEALTAKALDLHLARTFRGGATYASLSWEGASEAWIDRWWPRVGSVIAEGLSKNRTRDLYPTIVGDSLTLRSGPDLAGAELLPPTRAGWVRFLELAKASGHSFRALRITGQQWWRRSIPQDLLSRPAPPSPAAPPVERLPAAQPAAARRPSAAPAPRQPVIEPVWENADEATRQVSQAEAELAAWKRRLEARLQAARVSHHSLSLDAARLAKELTPRGLSPRGMKTWLIEQGWRRAAEVIDDRATGSVDELIPKVWAVLDGSLPRSKVGGSGQHRIVGKTAIAHVTGLPIVLVRDERGMQPRAVKVEIVGSEASGVRIRPQDGYELRVGEEVFDLARQNPITIAQLHTKMRMLESELRRAPMYLDSLRDVLLSSAILITHWSCRGDARDAAEQAFEQAKEYYFKARQHLDERRPFALLSRAYVSAERLAVVTAQLAEECRAPETQS